MALKFEYVTTMDQHYYDNVGRYMLNSFLKYSPSNCRINVYAENVNSKFTETDKLKVYDWNHVIRPQWKQFKSDVQKEIKFAKKGLTFIHALENIDTDYLIWSDADVMYRKEFKTKLITELCPKKYCVALFSHNYLGECYSAESGFVIVNKKHKHFSQFLNTYKNAYINKPHEIKKWYDGQVCMYAASHFKYKDLSDLSTDKNTHTPLNKCFLNEYMLHEKGPTKKRLPPAYFESFK